MLLIKYIKIKLRGVFQKIQNRKFQRVVKNTNCPLGLLCRRPQIFDVRLSVRCPLVSSFVAISLDHFVDPEMCNIAFKYPIKGGKKRCPSRY